MASKKSLERERRRLLRTLPPMEEILRGSLFERVRRCGKPGCHCAEGEGHPVFCVGVSFPGGKTTQISVPRELVPVVREWIANYERLRSFVEEVSEVNRELLRQRWVEPKKRGRRKRSS